MTNSLQELVNKFVADVQNLGSSDATPTTPAQNYEYDSSTGWSHTDASEFGCPRSQGVDELRNELNQKGYTKLAMLLPEYHCIAFWLDKSFPETVHLNVDKLRATLSNFGPFGATLDDNDEQTMVDNIVNTVFWYYSFWLRDPGTDPAKTEYRGQWNKDGFVKLNGNSLFPQPDFSPSLAPDYNTLVNRNEINRPGFPSFQLYERKSMAAPGEFRVVAIPNTVREDHWVYSPWWAGATDEDVTRFWRNWAVAYGAKVDL
jgi:hypothetical protein